MANPFELFSKQTSSWFQASIGKPTPVQLESWPAIKGGGNVLVSAPTGSGKTLSAFLVFIDKLSQLAKHNKLEEQIYLIYISPLKALGNDIRENLRKPLDGIGADAIEVAIRTGDTPQSQRRQMIKHPPHILITTPESLYLLLSSLSGQKMLETAHAVIIDELHALIGGKRGAHLMLSLARLDNLCAKSLQRIGLSATIKPLEIAAEYLATGQQVTIVNPVMAKDMDIEVNVPLNDMQALEEGTIWVEIGKKVHEYSMAARTVIVFVESRAHAEKLSYYVNKVGGGGFSKTHHGCVSKEQRFLAEQELRNGTLKVLCATSSMELGIDVGEVDLVLQIGYPRTISGTMQRLGRAGHNPGRVSVMHMLPRMASEILPCALTASLALKGAIEHASPPRKCLDVLAQHLVSMTVGDGYTVGEVMELLGKTYCFQAVSIDELHRVLEMLAGDYEHKLDYPVRPRILYDRINQRVTGDSYSRLLAVSTGGTIPDKGFFSVRLADGNKVGELDEEFVFEARVGDKFMLGAFAWRIKEMTKDTVVVSSATPEGAQPPFWKGDLLGRSYQTGIEFGRMMHGLTKAFYQDQLFDALRALKMDTPAAFNAMRYLERQFEATAHLPDDTHIILEHFNDPAGESQIMVHSIFGRRVNAGLALLVQDLAGRETGMDIHSYEDDDGFLIFPYGGGQPLPEGLLYRIDRKNARAILTAMLPATPIFNMNFRYNASRALMMGVRKGKRQPLWIQRLKSAETLDGAIMHKDHPLIVETKRECLEDYWDLPAIEAVLQEIETGAITISELHVAEPSPMSLPFRRKAESVLLYDYTPTTSHTIEASLQDLEAIEMIAPEQSALNSVSERKKMPTNEQELHSLMMIEGDLIAGELDIPIEWLLTLSKQNRVVYIEPGLWICAEQSEEYGAALCNQNHDEKELLHIIRRHLRYRGAQDAPMIAARYFLEEAQSINLLETLAAQDAVVAADGLYYHADLYSRAQKKTVIQRREQAKTLPPECFARLQCKQSVLQRAPQEQLIQALDAYLDQPYPPTVWENIILPARVQGYRPAMLDQLLTQGEFFWQFHLKDKTQICFHRHSDINWDEAPFLPETLAQLTEWEQQIVQQLHQRGASFSQSLPALPNDGSKFDVLLTLCEKGFIHADTFIPVRQWMEKDKLHTLPARQRAQSKAVTLSSGRWELARPLKALPLEEAVNRAFNRTTLLCRETARNLNWSSALELLRIWEYTGIVRRGYFIKGLSGAQFIRSSDYFEAVSKMTGKDDIIFWLNAYDPAQSWGKILPHLPGLSFKNIASTAVALKNGYPVLLLERQGKVLKILNSDCTQAALTALVMAYRRKRLFPALKKLVIKQYPKEAAVHLENAGFTRSMNDYAIWQSTY